MFVKTDDIIQIIKYFVEHTRNYFPSEFILICALF